MNKTATHWADGTPRSTGNAFTAAPKAILDTRASRSIKQILADQKGGIVIGKPADLDKRAGMRMANI